MAAYRLLSRQPRACRNPQSGRNLRVETLESRRLLSVEPLGPAFPVNPDASGQQYIFNESANAVAMDGAGNSIVVWTQSNDPFQSSTVRGRRLAVDGSPLGDDFLVNVDPMLSAGGASVAMNDSGAFVVVWTSSTNPWDEVLRSDVYARVFGPDGSPRSGEIPVNNLRTHEQSFPSIAIDDDGDFVVAWSSCFQDNDGSCDVHARRFDANGTPRTDEFRAANANVQPAFPSVSMSGDGRFVIAWEQSQDIYARLFSANGTTVRPAFVANDYTFNYQTYPSVSMGNDGAFVVAWAGVLQGGVNGIGARRFDAAGQPIAGQFDVDLRQFVSGQYPRVDVAPDGGFVVAWKRQAEQSAPEQAFIRAFEKHGAATSEAIQVTDHGAQGSIYAPSIAVSDGTILTAWSESSAPDFSNHVVARRYAITEPPPPEIRVTGNHQEIASGDTTPSLADFTDFGSVVIAGGSVERTFPIFNAGGGPLALVGSPRVSLSGPAAADFRITFQPAETVAAGATSSFTILFDPRALGVRTAAVRIISDDADEGEYVFVIQGDGVATPSTSSIQGRVWNDPNRDGLHQPEETGLPLVTMYVDANGNGRLDSGELSAETDLEGRYAFSGLSPGVYVISQVFSNDWEQTSPGPAAGFVRSVTLEGDPITDVDFLNHYLLGSLAPRVQGIAIGTSTGERAMLLPDGKRQLENQLAPAADEILIGFDRRVAVSAANVALTDAAGSTVEIDSCESDAGGPGTAVLRCRLAAPLANGRFSVQVTDAVLDLAGNALDGEWRNPVAPGAFGDLFPSGDGAPGGSFGFRFDLNLGDTNLDGQIDLDDLNNVRNHFGELSHSPGDADGDGDADTDDLNEIRNRFGSIPAAISNTQPVAALNRARDAVFGLLTTDAGATSLRRFTAKARSAR